MTLSLLPLSAASIPLPLLSLSLLPLNLSLFRLEPFHSFPLPPDLLLQLPQVGVVLKSHCSCFFEEQVHSVDETVISLDMVETLYVVWGL